LTDRGPVSTRFAPGSPCLQLAIGCPACVTRRLTSRRIGSLPEGSDASSEAITLLQGGENLPGEASNGLSEVRGPLETLTWGRMVTVKRCRNRGVPITRPDLPWAIRR
jgi:hypothetical protein